MQNNEEEKQSKNKESRPKRAEFCLSNLIGTC